VSNKSTGRVEFVLGDIAAADCDAIVNPNNSGFLQSAAGVNSAIAAAAGPDYAAEVDRLRERPAGTDVLVTGAGRLPARYVIHAVSPIWSGGGKREREALRRVHERVLETAAELGCTSIALPAIGTSAHRFPPEIAASIAVPTVESILEREPRLKRVLFVSQNRTILHDYLTRAHAGHHNQDATEILRAEIINNLHAAGEPALVDLVAALDDEATLRAIDAKTHELAHTLHAEGSVSLSVSSLYARAARRTLGLEPNGAPSLRCEPSRRLYSASENVHSFVGAGLESTLEQTLREPRRQRRQRWWRGRERQ
jgi:O-acetyl-ADP-ribose deacetylase (regulator of RNase III)